jgi:hypothetical protein
MNDQSQSTKDLTLVGVIAVRTPAGLHVPELLTKHEVAMAIGTTVRQVERLIAAGTLGSMTVHGRRYVTREQYDAYRGVHYTQPELDLGPPAQRGNDHGADA